MPSMIQRGYLQKKIPLLKYTVQEHFQLMSFYFFDISA